MSKLLMILFILVISLNLFTCGNKTVNHQTNDSLDLDHLKALRERYKKYKSGNIEYGLNNEGRISSLSFNKIPITDLPKEIYHFDQLEFLKFFSTNLKRIPDLTPFKHLENLYFISCKLSGKVFLPKSLGNLKELTITTSYNSKLSDIIFPKDCQIETLSLKGNDLKSINGSFSNLENLKCLDLARNQLKHIDVGYLKTINILILGGNPIKDTLLVKKMHKHINYISF
ncbi:leucine-rich repeat domain-containing protein [Microscilla marina]|uniref:Leucine-rich repeat containing protein, putative n=1 Tax=Microscilla marina ATCC 23134 TaxID=313606 RepID=A2A0E0_MICM2|nr:leucine-rich repeat domain-containing protein [Microscilla marina]EAY23895.1 leucine-rich repeat containing protein, putative [Microscilla marina ATCC 23134]